MQMANLKCLVIFKNKMLYFNAGLDFIDTQTGIVPCLMIKLKYGRQYQKVSE